MAFCSGFHLSKLLQPCALQQYERYDLVMQGLMTTSQETQHRRNAQKFCWKATMEMLQLLAALLALTVLPTDYSGLSGVMAGSDQAAYHSMPLICNTSTDPKVHSCAQL